MSNELKEACDGAAVACKLQMKKAGAISCHVYNEGSDRIIYSVEPYDDGVEHHVSVTRNGRSVNNKVLTFYAQKLIPEFDQYEMSEAQLVNGISHAWWKRKVVQS